MKKKVILSLILAIVVGVLVLAIFVSGCNPQPNGPNDNNRVREIIKPLPNLINYGAESYLNVPKATYGAEVQAAETQKIANKQTESRVDFVEEGEEWSNDKYYPFDTPYFKEVTFTPENGGKEWVDDKTTTVTKIFCYADAARIIERMSLAGIDQARMVKLVEYITRDDDTYKAYEDPRDSDPRQDVDDRRYPLTIGNGSAIFDYENLDEIADIRDNFKDYKDTPDGDTAFGKTEDEWEDLAKLKKRKIYGEIFKIFEDKGDMFSRFQMEYMTYQLQVVEETMIPAYESVETNPALGSPTTTKTKINSDKFKNYMRDEIFDYSMLSNFLAFADLTLPDVVGGIWRPTKKDKVMEVYGYTYQYQKNEYKVLNDADYREYLRLGHKEYFEDHNDALKFRDYDRKFYKEAYRYTADFYKAYYKAQYEFQTRQEDFDREIYVGVGFADGIGYPLLNDTTKYTDELLDGLNVGIASTLKLSDINYEYSGNDDNVRRYNKAARDWKSLDSKTQKQANQQIKKVRMQIEQLKTQQYMLKHKSKTDSDLIYALQYQIKSYSADYLSEMQSNKKTQVIQRKKLERLVATEGFEYPVDGIDAFAEQTNPAPEKYHVNAVGEKIEDLGRTVAMYKNITSDYSKSDVADQMVSAKNNNWKGVTSNIDDTLSVDYENYDKKRKSTDDTVDVYFEEKLIRKKYECQDDPSLPPDECQIKQDLKYDDNPKSHAHYATKHGEGEIIYCEKVYDTEWALSRLLNAHEDVLRHMSGTVEINFRRIENFSKYYDSSKGWTPNPETSEPPTYPSSDIQKIRDHKVISADYKEFEIVTLESGQEIGEIIINDDGDDRQPSLTKDRLRGIEANSQLIDGKMRHYSQTNEYEFDAWCVDEELLYEVDPDDKFRFSIKLYPRYTVRNIKDPNTVG